MTVYIESTAPICIEAELSEDSESWDVRVGDDLHDGICPPASLTEDEVKAGFEKALAKARERNDPYWDSYLPGGWT
jgi:hypothetical protein